MRDIADMILRGLREAAGPADADRDEMRSGRAARRRPAGDWCQTGPGDESIGRLAAGLRGAAGRGRHHGPFGKI